MVKRSPTILEYLHAAPGTYPTIDHPVVSFRPADPLDRRWTEGPAPQFLNPPPPDDDPNDTTPRILGPGGITNSAPYEGNRAPHMSLAAALASPLAEPEAPAAPFEGMAPRQPLPGGGHFDSGVAPLTAAASPMNPVDMANAMNPLRLPRRTLPGRASAQTRSMFSDKIGDVLLRLLGVSG